MDGFFAGMFPFSLFFLWLGYQITNPHKFRKVPTYKVVPLLVLSILVFLCLLWFILAPPPDVIAPKLTPVQPSPARVPPPAPKVPGPRRIGGPLVVAPGPTGGLDRRGHLT